MEMTTAQVEGTAQEDAAILGGVAVKCRGRAAGQSESDGEK